MKFYMIFHIPSGGFYKTIGTTFDELIFSGVTQGKRLTRQGVSTTMESILANEKNGVDQEDLEIYEFIGTKI